MIIPYSYRSYRYDSIRILYVWFSYPGFVGLIKLASPHEWRQTRTVWASGALPWRSTGDVSHGGSGGHDVSHPQRGDHTFGAWSNHQSLLGSDNTWIVSIIGYWIVDSMVYPILNQNLPIIMIIYICAMIKSCMTWPFPIRDGSPKTTMVWLWHTW